MKFLVTLLITLGISFGQSTTSLTLTAPPPPAETGISLTRVGNAGNATYYYWVVVRYAGGNSAVSPSAIITTAPNVLGVSNYVRVNWDSMPNATGYDVLRTTTASVPNGNCNCAVTTNTSATTVDDTGGALGAYTVTSQGGASTNCRIDNITVVTPTVICNPYSFAGGSPGGAAGGALSGTYPNPTIANLSTVGVVPYTSSAGVVGESIISQTTKTGTVDGIARLVPPVVIGGVNRVIQSQPATESKRIVIYGSSVAAGTGASTYANSWAGLFTTAMTAKGYTISNQSIGGNSTANLLSRFWTDVAPLAPDFVILCSGFPDDGYDQTTFVANTHRLIKMIRSIGATPVIFGQYGDNTVNPNIIIRKRQMYAYFDKLGIQVTDMLGSVTDPATGYWLPGTFSDALHPNDTGHAIMFNCIPLTWFDNYNFQVASDKHLTSAAWTIGVGNASNIPIGATLATAAPSWTAAVWVKDNSTPGRVAIGVLDGTGAMVMRIRSQSNVWEATLASGSTVLSTVNAISRQWHHVAATYQGNTGELKLYIDGVYIGVTTGTYTGALTFSFGGRGDISAANLVGGSIAMPVAYRACLELDDIKQLYGGNIPVRSLEFYSSLTQLPTGTLVRNEADTSTLGSVGDITYTSGPVPFAPVPVNNVVTAAAIFSNGIQPTVSSGTITAGSGNNAGSITSATTGVYTGILTFSVTALVEWSCSITNSTTANLIRQTAGSGTTATFSGTTVSGDVLRYTCMAY